MLPLKHLVYSRAHRAIGTPLLAALLMASTGAAAGPQGQTPTQGAPAVATGQLGGTTLTVTPDIGTYERAVLRVSGPAHYALTKRFEANAPISADLLAGGQRAADGRENDQASNTLPRGRYRYEVVFHTGSAKPKAHTGTFQYPR